MGDRGLEEVEALSGANKTSISGLLRCESLGTLRVIARLERVLGEDLWGSEHRQVAAICLTRTGRGESAG